MEVTLQQSRAEAVLHTDRHDSTELVMDRDGYEVFTERWAGQESGVGVRTPTPDSRSYMILSRRYPSP